MSASALRHQPPAAQLGITGHAPSVEIAPVRRRHAAARKRRAATSRRAATERTRRWRARRRRGRICALVELTDEQHRWLFRFGGLADHEATDRTAIARALGVLLDHAAEALRWEIARGFKKL